jgi:hypothetical protein
MTYGKFVEQRLVCFIPGRVLDESLNVLAVVRNALKVCTDTNVSYLRCMCVAAQ